MVHRDLEQLEAVPRRQQCMQRSELCRSLAGNVCPLITITNPSPEPHTPRPAVVFTGQWSLPVCVHWDLSGCFCVSALSEDQILWCMIIRGA